EGCRSAACTGCAAWHTGYAPRRRQFVGSVWRRREGLVSMSVLAAGLRLDMDGGDYFVLALYFLVVLGIGFAACRSVSSSLDFFLSGRSLPAWVTGLAFIAANLRAVEILG